MISRILWAVSFASGTAAIVALSFMIFATLTGDDASSNPTLPAGAGFVAQPTPRPRATPTAAAAAPRSPVEMGFRLEVTRTPRFTWPAVGPITSYFGRGHPTGIDIGLDHDGAGAIRAAADGVVSFAGGDECCGYGLYVVIDHDEGSSTLYGHLAAFSVELGQRVVQGQVIGVGGSTGNSDGRHLHFELRVGGVLVDPLRYLPVVQESPYRSHQEGARCSEDVVRLEAASQTRIVFQGATAAASFQLQDLQAFASQSGAPGLQVLFDGPRAAIIEAPAPLTTGVTYRYQLQAFLRLGDATEVITCSVELGTRSTLPNPERPAGHEHGVAEDEGPAPVAPTATPTPRPAPTATNTPAPRGTPIVRPTSAPIEREPPPRITR